MSETPEVRKVDIVPKLPKVILEVINSVHISVVILRLLLTMDRLVEVINSPQAVNIFQSNPPFRNLT